MKKSIFKRTLDYNASLKSYIILSKYNIMSKHYLPVNKSNAFVAESCNPVVAKSMNNTNSSL